MRVSTNSNYNRVLAGIRLNLAKLVRANEQIATGQRILRPSDDPTGTSRILSLQRLEADNQRFIDSINSGLTTVNTAASNLEDASGILTEIRAKLLQGMNGSAPQSARDSIANDIELLREQLIEIANGRSGEQALFGGTELEGSPWQEVSIGGRDRVLYLGNSDEQRIRIGSGVELALNVDGALIFGRNQASGTSFAGLTGVVSGTTADEGFGYEYLTLRHDATDPGSLSSVGISLVNGGADDTLLGSQTLNLDPVAGTMQLGSGPVVSLPSPGATNVALENEFGGTLHLDFSGYSGAAFSGTVVGEGSASLDGQTFTPLTFSETDLELVHPESGAIVHLDTTGVRRAGVELTSFDGNTNVFDVLQGAVDDLRNGDGLQSADLMQRLNIRLEELDRNQENLLQGLGELGARSARLSSTERRLQDVNVDLQGLLSTTKDADISEVGLDMGQAVQSLELAQAAGARLLQTSLLNFL